MRANNWLVGVVASVLVVFTAQQCLGAEQAASTPPSGAAASAASGGGQASVPAAGGGEQRKTGQNELQQLPPQAKYSPWLALFVLAVSGFFGGFVDGLRSTRTYNARFGRWSQDWGSVGDGLIGMGAALAIFAFAESIFSNVTQQDRVTAWFLTKIVAWGVLSGWAGTKLLDDLSSKAIRQMIQQETGKQVAEQNATVQDESNTIREAEQLRTRHLAKAATLAQGQKDADTEDLAKRAILKFKSTLQKNPANRDARNGLANTLADLGVYYLRVDPADPQAKPLFEQAIKLADALVAEDAGFAKGYYNRACYKAVAGGALSEVIADLKTAFKLDPHFREYALSDVDLNRVHADPFWAAEVAVKPATAKP